MSGISTCMKEAKQISLFMCHVTVQPGSPSIRNKTSPDLDFAGAFSQNFQPPELWALCLCLQMTLFVSKRPEQRYSRV